MDVLGLCQPLTPMNFVQDVEDKNACRNPPIMNIGVDKGTA